MKTTIAAVLLACAALAFAWRCEMDRQETIITAGTMLTAIYDTYNAIGDGSPFKEWSRTHLPEQTARVETLREASMTAKKKRDIALGAAIACGAFGLVFLLPLLRRRRKD